MVELYVNINILKGFFIWMSFSLATTRDGQKKPTQKNPPTKTQSKKTLSVFLVFFRWPTSGGATSRTRSVCLSVSL